MITEYEVNSNTLILLPIGSNVTKVIEKQEPIALEEMYEKLK